MSEATSTPDPAPPSQSEISPPVPQVSNSRPRSRGGIGVRGRNRTPRPSKPKFRGETESMNGHVFQSPEESKDATKFTKTMEALEHHCTTKYDSDSPIYLLLLQIVSFLKLRDQINPIHRYQILKMTYTLCC